MPRNQIKVFLSSMSYASPEHHKAILQVFNALALQPVGLEYSAVTDHAIALRKQHIFDSDIFVGVYASYPGWEPLVHDGKSLAELEYQWAGEAIHNERPIPRLCFTAVDTEPGGNWLRQQQMVVFTSPEDLAAQLRQALYDALKTTVLSHYEEALVLSMETNHTREQADVLQNIGGLYRAMSDTNRSIEYYRQALVLFVKLGDKFEQAITLNDIGSLYQALGEKGKALGCYQQALPLCSEVGNKAEQAATLNNLGGVHQTLGESEKALGYLQQSLALYIEIGDNRGQALTLNSIGGVYSAVGQQDQALHYAEESHKVYFEVNDAGGQAAALNNIGLAYSRLGEKAKALDYYQQALARRVEAGDAHGEAVTRSNIAAILWDQGQQDQAAIYMKQASDLVSGTGTSTNIQDDYLHFSTASGVSENKER